MKASQLVRYAIVSALAMAFSLPGIHAADYVPSICPTPEKAVISALDYSPEYQPSGSGSPRI